MKNAIYVSLLLGAAATGIVSFVGSSKDQGPVIVERSAYVTKHINLLLVPDLSNRVDLIAKPKPISDQEIFSIVLNDIEDVYLRNQNRRMNQQDRFSVLFTNQNLITDYAINMEKLSIDFSIFPKQRDRIDYIKGKDESTSLVNDRSAMLTEINRVYKKVAESMNGADVWSFLENLDESSLMTSGSIPSKKMQNGTEFRNEYRNILIFLTDGYIETEKGWSGKICNSLTQSRINNFRMQFLTKGKGRSLAEFFNDEGYGITPLNNELLKETEIIILEMDDRSINEKGNATHKITDQMVIELFWNDWFKKSGIKKHKLVHKANRLDDLNRQIKNFIL